MVHFQTRSYRKLTAILQNTNNHLSRSHKKARCKTLKILHVRSFTASSPLAGVITLHFDQDAVWQMLWQRSSWRHDKISRHESRSTVVTSLCFVGRASSADAMTMKFAPLEWQIAVLLFYMALNPWVSPVNVQVHLVPRFTTHNCSQPNCGGPIISRLIKRPPLAGNTKMIHCFGNTINNTHAYTTIELLAAETKTNISVWQLENTQSHCLLPPPA